MVSEMQYIVEHRNETSFNLTGHLYLFLDFLTRSAASMKISADGRMRDFYIKEALNYIEQNFQNDISVEGIAAFCGLNRTYFGRIFKDTVGQSPAAVPAQLPHDQSRGAAETDCAVHQ